MTKSLFFVSAAPRPFRIPLAAMAAVLFAASGSAPAQSIPERLATAGRTPGREGVLFQASTLDALSSGVYHGSFSLAEIRQHGDFGVGTYEGLVGEMILLNGRFFQMRSNGLLSEATEEQRSPFAVVTHFRPDAQFSIRQASLTQVAELIDTVLPSRNFFYAVKIHGPFTAMSTRAIAKQFLPYAPLAQLIPTQSVFNYGGITGTAVGIRSPAFIAGVNQVGYHFHFVSDDLKSGGHALSFTTGEVTVEIQVLRRHLVALPDDEPFVKAVLPLP